MTSLMDEISSGQAIYNKMKGKPMYKTNIAYDFDGVLCSTMPAFHLYWKETYNWEIYDRDGRSFEMPMPKDYNFKHISNDIVEAINKYQRYLYPHTFAMEMVREFANKWNETPIIITARSAENAEVTDLWLKNYLGIPYTLVCVGGDTGEAKPETIQKYGIQYFVEDRFKTCNAIKSCDTVFMPDRAWNAGRETLDHVTRVNNLVDVWEEIFETERAEADTHTQEVADA